MASTTRSVNSTDFASMLAIADAISSDTGNYQQMECLGMKHTLMDIGVTERGRASMANFYRLFRRVTGGYSVKVRSTWISSVRWMRALLAMIRW